MPWLLLLTEPYGLLLHTTDSKVGAADGGVVLCHELETAACIALMYGLLIVFYCVFVTGVLLNIATAPLFYFVFITKISLISLLMQSACFRKLTGLRFGASRLSVRCQ